jgi:hypothetical protein
MLGRAYTTKRLEEKKKIEQKKGQKRNSRRQAGIGAHPLSPSLTGCLSLARASSRRRLPAGRLPRPRLPGGTSTSAVARCQNKKRQLLHICFSFP